MRREPSLLLDIIESCDDWEIVWIAATVETPRLRHQVAVMAA